MMCVKQLYSYKTSATPDQAKALQQHVAYILCNFGSDTGEMTVALDDVRDFLLANLGLEGTQSLRKIVGITTTAQAFRVPPHLAMSQGPEDTRIAFLIGKPALGRRSSSSEPEWGLEQRYAVALRIVDRSTVFLSKVQEIPRRFAYHAKGHPVHEAVLAEGKRISTCCKRARILPELVTSIVQEGIDTFEWLVDMLSKQLGLGSALLLELQKMHSVDLPNSPPQLACTDTLFIEGVVTSAKQNMEERELSECANV